MTSRTADADVRRAYRRRLQYVDSSVQRSLLMTLVSLEVVLVAALTWLAQWRLNDLIEDSLYRVHLDQTGSALIQLLQEGSWVLGPFVVVNVLALLAAEGIWSHHENLVIQDFAALIGKTRGLDFSKDAETRRQHEVLTLAMSWRARERTRFAAIHEQVVKLENAASARESAPDIRNAVQRLRKLLT